MPTNSTGGELNKSYNPVPDNGLAEKAKNKGFTILQLQPRCPQRFTCPGFTAIIMAWQKKFSLSLFQPLSIHSSIHPSICTIIFVPVCFNIIIAWFHCCVHAIVTDSFHILLLHYCILFNVLKTLEKFNQYCCVYVCWCMKAHGNASTVSKQLLEYGGKCLDVLGYVKTVVEILHYIQWKVEKVDSLGQRPYNYFPFLL